MSEKEKFNKIKYDNQYAKDHYDILRAACPKSKNLRERIKAAAERDQISPTQWIIKAIEKELEWYE